MQTKADTATKLDGAAAAMWLTGNVMFEMHASKSGAWTVVATRSSMNNLACIQGTGTDLQQTGNKFPPPKADPA